MKKGPAKSTPVKKATPKRRPRKTAPPKTAPPQKTLPKRSAPILPLRPVATGPDADAFWAMIARIDDASRGDLAAACTAFHAELEALDDSTLLAMVHQFRDAMVRAMDDELRSAAYMLHGGCSDDSFWDFRAGLVALGREHYEAVLRDPDELATIPDVANRTLFEGFQYEPESVLEARGLACEPPHHGPGGVPPTRAWLEEAERAERFPKLTARAR